MPFFILLFAICIIISNVSQSQINDYTLEELTKKSSCIVLAKTDSLLSYWSEDRKRIYTNVKLKIETIIKGESISEEIIIRIFGGTINGISTSATGLPTFRKDEESILFLSYNYLSSLNKKSFYVIGGNQGKFDFVYNNNEKYLIRDNFNRYLFYNKNKKEIINLKENKKMNYDLFLSLIKSSLK